MNSNLVPETILSLAIDAISDDFQSTFSVHDNGLVVNMLAENEQDEVRAIFQKHISNCDVTFSKIMDIPGRPCWAIKVFYKGIN